MLAGFAVSGAAALIYEVVWTRQLSLVLGSTVYAVSIMLAAFMSGLSLGSWIGGRRVDRDGVNPLRDYVLLELAICLSGLLSLVMLRWLPMQVYFLGDLAARSWALFIAGQVMFSFLVMLVPTTLMGWTFPVVSRIVTDSMDRLGTSVGGAYSINTLGSIVGSVAAGFLLIPLIGMTATVLFAASLNLIVAVALVVAAERSLAKWAIGAAALLVVGGTAMMLTQRPANIRTGIYEAVRYSSVMDFRKAYAGSEVLFDEVNAYSRVTVLKSPHGAKALQNGGRIEGSTSEADMSTQQLLAVLPAAYHEATTGRSYSGSTLIIGLGTGFTAKAALDHTQGSVDVVEINPSVVRAANHFIGESLDDPRMDVAVADARWWLARSQETYDVVTSEPSWPVAASVTPLFTQEFFAMVSGHLNEGGVFCQWLPQYLLDRPDFMMMYKTFESAFPGAQVWSSGPDLFLIGVKGGDFPDPEKVHALVEQRLPTAMLTAPDYTDTLREALQDESIPFNTDDRPVLETVVAKNIADLLGEQRRQAVQRGWRGNSIRN